jgi:hypothetical protein
MNRMMMTALACGLLISATLAQEAADPSAAPKDPNAPTMAVESGAPVELATEAEKTAIQIVMLSALPEDATPLDVTEDADALATLRAAIGDNAAVKAKLEAGGYAIDDVVAMTTNVDGAIIVYVDDRG